MYFFSRASVGRLGFSWSRLGSVGLHWLPSHEWGQVNSMYLTSSLGQQLLEGCSQGERKGTGTEAKLTTIVHLRLLYVSCLLRFHWPKQVTKPSQTSVVWGNIFHLHGNDAQSHDNGCIYRERLRIENRNVIYHT